MLKKKSLTIPFRRLDTAVLKHAKYKNSPNLTAQYTRKNLLNAATSFNDYLTLTNQSITPDTIAAYLTEVKLTQAAATWNLTRQNLKTAFRLQPGIRDSYPLKMIVEEIFRNIKPIKLDRKVKEYLTSEEIDKLIAGSSKRLGLIITFIFRTGVRISEMTSIRLQDIEIGDKVTIDIVGKGNKQRSVYISFDLYHDIMSCFNGEFWLFENKKAKQISHTTLWRHLKNAGREILHREIHPHMIRHSTVNFLLHVKKKSPRYIKELLGHADIGTTLGLYVFEDISQDMVEQFE